MKWRDALKTFGLGAASIGLSRGTGAAKVSGKRPNIIFIMTDDHASHAMSCYGSKIKQDTAPRSFALTIR